MNQGLIQLAAAAVWGGLLVTAWLGAQEAKSRISTMPRMGSVEERFQSYNIEMVEVTGGILEALRRAGPPGINLNATGAGCDIKEAS